MRYRCHCGYICCRLAWTHMDDTISNAVLLDHMQAMNGELSGQIKQLDGRVGRLEKVALKGFEETRLRFDETRLRFEETRQRFEETRQSFEEARQHREALQEDLYATIKMVAKHDRRLAKL